MLKILGVDPGIHGGLAVVVVNSGSSVQLLDAVDIPVVGVGAKERIDVAALRDSTRLFQRRTRCSLARGIMVAPRRR